MTTESTPAPPVPFKGYDDEGRVSYAIVQDDEEVRFGLVVKKERA